MDCASARRLVERSFADDPVGGAFAAVREHLRACAGCRAVYDALADAEAALAGDAALPAPALERVRATALAGNEAPAARRWRGAWLLAPAAVVIAAGAVALVVVPPRDGRAPALGPGGLAPPTARGAPDAGAAVTHPQGLRALCLAQEGGETVVRSLGTRPLPGEAPRCTVRDQLGFAVRNETGRDAHLGLAARDRAGRVHLLFPAPAVGDASAGVGPVDDRVPASQGDAALDAVLPLDRVGAGELRVLGVFADRALDHAAFGAAARDADPPQALARLGGYVIEITVEIGP
jgi:hypothetical protein